MSFSADVKTWTKKAETKNRDVMLLSSLELFRRIIFRTPVDTGRLRANWQCSLNDPIQFTTINTDAEGGSTVSNVESAIANADWNDIIYLTNNVTYGYDIEVNGRSRVKAPQGMVRISVEEWPQIVNAVIAQLR